ncbi:MAG: TolC family protein [Elusimicrobiota bacterium]
MKRKMPVIVLGLIAIALFSRSGFAAEGEIFTLDEYLEQVEKNNPELKSVDLSIQAMEKKVLELEMVYSPVFSAGYNYTDDKSGAGFGSTLPAKEMKAGAYTLGLNKKFFTGSTVGVGYTSSRAKFDLFSPTKIIGDEELSGFTGYEIKPFLHVEQSLLRDFSSGLTQLGIKKAKAAARAGQYLQLFKRQQILMQARSAYWSLVLTREVILSRKVSLERAEKLLKWNEKRVNMDLADRGDLLQTQAAAKLRQLNLELALEDEVKAGRRFNELRGISAEVIEEELEKLAYRVSYYAKVETLSRTGERADVLAARAAYENSQYADRETYYRALPEIVLSGSASLHGLGLKYADAQSQIDHADKPVYALGIALIVPLDYRTLTEVKKGFKLDFLAAKESLAKAELSAKNEWEQLLRTWTNLKLRVKLATEIREIQDQRVLDEQFKFERGRTTTFQLLTAENDLDEALINVYRLTWEELLTYAQTEFYNTKPL